MCKSTRPQEGVCLQETNRYLYSFPKGEKELVERVFKLMDDGIIPSRRHWASPVRALRYAPCTRSPRGTCSKPVQTPKTA